MRRKEYLEDPVMERALLQLKRDQRVADFCGEDIKPGWLVTRAKPESENYVKFELSIKGKSGKLKSVVIGDYLTHKDLVELQKDKEEYVKLKAESKDEKERAKADEEYVPVDFDAYSIPDLECKGSEQKIAKQNLGMQEPIWRISSLTASVDDDTKILVLPIPESKREVKIAETNYAFQTYGDLFDKASKID